MSFLQYYYAGILLAELMYLLRNKPKFSFKYWRKTGFGIVVSPLTLVIDIIKFLIKGFK